MNKTTEAIAWMLADAQRTQQQAAQMFGISQASISQAMRRENDHLQFLATIPADKVQSILTYLAAQPNHTAKGAAFNTGLDKPTVRRIVIACGIKAARDEAIGKRRPSVADQVREECALIADAMGASIVAATIRGTMTCTNAAWRT